MKDTTNQWLNYAFKDLKAAEELVHDENLTNIVAFHAQQCVEKSFKAIMIENGMELVRTHALMHLYGRISGLIEFTINRQKLQQLDSVYITTRYPTEAGFLPEGQPSPVLASELIDFAREIFDNTHKTLASK